MTGKPTKDSREAFLRNHNLNPEHFEQSGLTWTELDKIREHYESETDNLHVVGNNIMEQLQLLPDVHSVKLRLKNADHLIAKIVRKSVEKGDLEITLGNYEEVITDLIGVRALHLFKGQWKPIDLSVRNHWDLHETPIAYHREGDSLALIDAFREAGFQPTQHDAGYRSLHYLLKSRPNKKNCIVEVQVRTLFEEAWSEIDHKIRYPKKTSDASLGHFLNIFNGLAGYADEMGTFIQTLANRIVTFEALEASNNEAKHEMEKKLRDTIARLDITTKNRDELSHQVAQLTAPSLSSPAQIADLAFTRTDANESFFFGKPTPGILATQLASITPGATLSPGQLFITAPTKCPHCAHTNSRSSAGVCVCQNCKSIY